jgi:hypothetical protein
MTKQSIPATPLNRRLFMSSGALSFDSSRRLASQNESSPSLSAKRVIRVLEEALALVDDCEELVASQDGSLNELEEHAR